MGVLVVFVTLGVLQLWGSGSSSPLAAAPVNPAPMNQPCRSCIAIDNVCYNHTRLFELNVPFGDKPAIYKMAVMHSSNILYYIFKPPLDDPEYSKAAYVSLDYPYFAGVISGLQSFNFETVEINQNEEKVYLGGSDGIWTVNSTYYFPKYFTAKGAHISNIASREHVYFTIQYHLGLYEHYKYRNYSVDLWLDFLEESTIKKFVFDLPDKYNMVYLNNSGLFFAAIDQKYSLPVRQTWKISPESYFRGLTVDVEGRVYAWDVDGIYKVVSGVVFSKTTLRKVSGLDPDAMAFDRSNNIIYSSGKWLYKLIKVASGNCNSVMDLVDTFN